MLIIDDKYPTFSFGIQGDNSPYNALYRGFLEASAVMEHTPRKFFL